MIGEQRRNIITLHHNINILIETAFYCNEYTA